MLKEKNRKEVNMNYIEEYILLDRRENAIYKTFDILDLARKIIDLNNEIIYINHAENNQYDNRKLFDYHLTVKRCEIKDLEKSDK